MGMTADHAKTLSTKALKLQIRSLEYMGVDLENIEPYYQELGKRRLAKAPIASTLVIGRRSKYDTKGTYPVNLDGTTVGQVVAVKGGYAFYRGAGKTAQRMTVSITHAPTMKKMRETLAKHVS